MRLVSSAGSTPRLGQSRCLGGARAWDGDEGTRERRRGPPNARQSLVLSGGPGGLGLLEAKGLSAGVRKAVGSFRRKCRGAQLGFKIVSRESYLPKAPRFSAREAGTHRDRGQA